MLLRHIKKNLGQVILETTLILISLAVLAAASARLFSNLNLNILNRLDVYRDSRRNAVNNPASLAGTLLPIREGETRPAANPTTFLEYYPLTSITIPPDPLSGSFSGLFSEDSRITDAVLLLEEQDLLMNLVGYYKVNQANYLASQLQWGIWWKCCDGEGQYYFYVGWNYPEYVGFIRSLTNETIDFTNRGYNDFSSAINLYKEVLNDPIIPGPFDPDVEANAALYGFDPIKDAEAIANLQEQNDQNRAGLQTTITTLEAALPGLNTFRNLIINGQGPFLGLNYVSEWIGDLYQDDYGYYPSWQHNQAVNTLNQAVDFIGSISSPILVSGLAQKINQVDSLFGGGLSYAEAEQAKSLSAEILRYSQVQNNDTLKGTVESLSNNLNFTLKYWGDEKSKDYYLGYAQLESWALSEVAEITSQVGSVSPPRRNPWW